MPANSANPSNAPEAGRGTFAGGGVKRCVAKDCAVSVKLPIDRGSSYGMTFLTPPEFDLSQITAAGIAGGWSPFALNSAVGQYGGFDFQRSKDVFGNTPFYTQY